MLGPNASGKTTPRHLHGLGWASAARASRFGRDFEGIFLPHLVQALDLRSVQDLDLVQVKLAGSQPVCACVRVEDIVGWCVLACSFSCLLVVG